MLKEAVKINRRQKTKVITSVSYSLAMYSTAK